MITLDSVSKSYPTPAGRKIVLDNATLTFAAGHNFGILGANGAGKSTLLRLLAGTEHPDRGVVRRAARVSFPLGFGGTFHGALSRYSGADGTSEVPRHNSQDRLASGMLLPLGRPVVGAPYERATDFYRPASCTCRFATMSGCRS